MVCVGKKRNGNVFVIIFTDVDIQWNFSEIISSIR